MPPSEESINHPILAQLSDKQKDAVLSDDKRLLVLAGAGSGKTKTLIQKIIYLLFAKQIRPRNILAITFTKNAANEMIDRLIFTADTTGIYKKIIMNKKISYKDKEKARYEYMAKYPWIRNITVKTFHSLCYSIMRKHGSPEFDNKFKVLIDKLDEDELEIHNKATETQDEIIRDLIVKRCEDIDYLLKLKRYILDFYVDKIQTIPRYQTQLYDNKIYTTLRGEKVRSKSERYIADWLYRHNVDYVYEPIIDLKDFQFTPDFFIPEINTYIEHVSNLSKGTKEKEEQFDLTGHTLFKTFENMTRNINEFYAALERIVFGRFDKKISENTAIRYEEEFKSYHDKVHIFIQYVISAIDKIKVSNHDFNKVYDKAMSSPYDRVKIFYELLKPVYDDYHDYCTRKSYLDFNDLLLKTVDLLKNNNDVKNHYRELFQYVLVDEFQDVNNVQVELLFEILDEKTQLFCVGDDWQSIYGFRGSEVEYIVNFETYFPTAVIKKLSINYRSNDVIVNASNEVIKNNKFKIDKEIKSANSSGKKIYLYCAQREEEDGVNTVAEKIQQLYKSGFVKEDILCLYRRTDTYKPYSQKFREKGLKVQARTIHASKGLEAKIVFIIGLKDGIGGFPNVWEDDQIFQIIRRTNYDLLMEEERRLFYVALTRAKEELFLISEQGNESIFLAEIPGEFLDRTNFLILNIKKQEPILCSNCNEKIKKDYIFCPYCGIKAGSINVQNENESELLEQAIESYSQNEDEYLKNKLREWRWKKAKKKNIPAYCIIQNKVILEIVKKKPTTLSELEKIYGIGNRKIKQYGEELLSIIVKNQKGNNVLVQQQNVSFSEEEYRYKILGCLKEMKFTPRITLLCEILKGSLSEKTSDLITEKAGIYGSLKDNKYFGALESCESEKIITLINSLMEQGYLENYDKKRDFGDPFIRLTSKGILFLVEKKSNINRDD